MEIFRQFSIVLLLLLQNLSVYCQADIRPVSGAAAAMGNCSLSMQGNWDGFTNQASLAYQRQFWVGAHHENRFMLSELGLSMLGFAIPVKPGTFGIDISHLGFSGFSTSRAGLGYGMFLGKRFAAGVGLALTRMQLPADYRNATAFTVEGGVHYMPTSKLTFGFYVFNPTGSTFDDLGDLPTLMGLGVTYLPSQNILLAFQIDDDTQRAPTFRFGLEYRVMERTALRLGYSAASPEGITAGVGLPVKGFDIDFSLSHHQQLGFTPSLSVAYLFGKKDNKTQ
ncbi:hypothetical protein [Tenuifilum sp.]|uniref:hypothetical protein n=1 Tax=Tenuifilum sp. TaxID=2760880 RepID=UPI001B4F9B28|nr:hypothetical protein [Bacteroidales bacterium]HOU73870.1 hypothetical protein [Tenuifilum sp.]MBP9029579.1 hypothetical protein [Bacteroidales bacterium]HQE55597.1 hypothetical protein [Tenuifilum sp.]HQG73567.1 hypothetical protein [Tenuifilum sp.]